MEQSIRNSQVSENPFENDTEKIQSTERDDVSGGNSKSEESEISIGKIVLKIN